MVEIILERTFAPGIFVRRLVNGVVGIVVAAFALRFVLVLLGASTASRFVSAVYEFTDTLLGPFRGAFSNIVLAGFTIDVTTLFAMIGYVVIGWLVVQLLLLVLSVSLY